MHLEPFRVQETLFIEVNSCIHYFVTVASRNNCMPRCPGAKKSFDTSWPLMRAGF